MPIYAYKCESCGHAKDVLQKMSDAPLTDCPQCGASTFKKQLTAAGFQLKGSGWYVTDFKGGTPSGAPPGQSAEGGSSADTPAAATASTAAPTATPAPAAASPAPAAASPAAPTPAPNKPKAGA
ncbi:MAG: zinc ribbon domain-containing protein [Chitinophagaceae bacterium]|nr:zinc ribbon domain-containing protein [Polaromonas sp.]